MLELILVASAISFVGLVITTLILMRLITPQSKFAFLVIFLYRLTIFIALATLVLLITVVINNSL